MTASRIATAALTCTLIAATAVAAPATGSAPKEAPAAGAEIILAATGGRGIPKAKGKTASETPKKADEAQGASNTATPTKDTTKAEPGFFERLFSD
ncbi:MAG: hypothetical protein AAF713_01105 [Pseudomonadota bacterium]